MRPPQSPSQSTRACSSFRLTKTAMQRHTVMVGMDTKERAIDRGVRKGMPQSAAGITASNCQSQSQWSLALVSGVSEEEGGRLDQTNTCPSVSRRVPAIDWSRIPGFCARQPITYIFMGYWTGLLLLLVYLSSVFTLRHCTASPVHHYLARPLNNLQECLCLREIEMQLQLWLTGERGRVEDGIESDR